MLRLQFHDSISFLGRKFPTSSGASNDWTHVSNIHLKISIPKLALNVTIDANISRKSSITSEWYYGWYIRSLVLLLCIIYLCW